MSLVPGSITITLHHPVEVEGARLCSLALRRPKVRDQKMAMRHGGTDFDQEIMLFAHLCEQAPETIELLDLQDYKQLQDAYSGFLS